MSNINRRALVAGAAATLPAIAAGPAAAATLNGPDPIFAVIEAHKSNHAAFLARCRYEDELEEKGIRLERAIDDYRTPEMVALVDAGIAARVAIAETAPTTPAGLAAVLRFIDEETDKLGDFFFPEETDESQRFVRTMERAVLGMTGALQVQS
jgi:ABC-type sugar transport system substrate-binding protein